MTQRTEVANASEWPTRDHHTSHLLLARGARRGSGVKLKWDGGCGGHTKPAKPGIEGARVIASETE